MMSALDTICHGESLLDTRRPPEDIKNMGDPSPGIWRGTDRVRRDKQWPWQSNTSSKSRFIGSEKVWDTGADIPHHPFTDSG